MELQLAELAEGRVRFGPFTLLWIAHTERTSYRLVGFTAATDADGVTLTTSAGEGWNGAVSRDFRASVRLELARMGWTPTAVPPERVRVVKTVVQGLQLLRCVTEEGGIRIGLAIVP